METSALLTAGEALGVACATLCLGTVDGISQEKLAAEPLALGEKLMFSIALDAITMKEDLK
jgi:uridine phosphorylase